MYAWNVSKNLKENLIKIIMQVEKGLFVNYIVLPRCYAPPFATYFQENEGGAQQKGLVQSPAPLPTHALLHMYQPSAHKQDQTKITTRVDLEQE